MTSRQADNGGYDTLPALTAISTTPLPSISAARIASSGSSTKPRAKLIVVTRSPILTLPSMLTSPRMSAPSAAGGGGGGGEGGGGKGGRTE